MALSEDIELFAKYGLKNHTLLEVPWFHKEIYGLVTSLHERIAIAAPRGFAKSTTVSLVYALHTALTQKKKFIVLISDTYSQAKLFLDSIKRELEFNPMLTFAFGNQVTDKWAEGEIELKSGTKIIAKGQGMKMRGLKHGNTRPDLVILDDLENNELVESPERREKLERWLNSEVLPSLAQGGQVVYIGTLIHDDALLSKVLKGYEGWEKRLYKAVMDGKSLWPERYTLEDIDKIRIDYHNKGLTDVFYAEYMNEPMNEALAEFKASYFKYYRDDQCPSNLRIYTTVDLAISKKASADETVVMTVGVAPDNTKYILEYTNAKLDLFETVEAIFQHYDKWHDGNPGVFGIETVAYQQAMVQLLKKEMMLRNKFFNIEEIRSTQDKQIKIRGLLPHYRSGAIYHRAGVCEALENQLLRFPKGQHDDIIDALAFQINLWNSPMYSQPEQVKRKGETIKQLLRKEGFTR